MVKRLISANVSEILAMSSQELKQSIKASEGRVILSENVAPRESFIGDITNSEMARAFGADLILLNGIDVLNFSVASSDFIFKSSKLSILLSRKNSKVFDMDFKLKFVAQRS